MLFRSRLAWIFLAIVAAPSALVGAASGCNGDSDSEPRRGIVGDSCTKTDDCALPLRCIANECVAFGGSGSGGSGGGGTFDGGLPDGFGPGPGPSADAGPWSQCDQCLEMQCGQQEKACGSDCLAIEACIETFCAHLSETGSSEEGACFVFCQDRFPNGKTQHLALVDCAQTQTCQPPCTFYPQDYDLCRTFMNNGDCTGYLALCEATPGCTQFRDCVKFCDSVESCAACDDMPDMLEGRKMLEAYQHCVASECLTESWIP